MQQHSSWGIAPICCIGKVCCLSLVRADYRAAPHGATQRALGIAQAVSRRAGSQIVELTIIKPVTAGSCSTHNWNQSGPEQGQPDWFTLKYAQTLACNHFTGNSHTIVLENAKLGTDMQDIYILLKNNMLIYAANTYKYACHVHWSKCPRKIIHLKIVATCGHFVQCENKYTQR